MLGASLPTYAQSPLSRLTWQIPDTAVSTSRLPKVDGSERGVMIQGVLQSSSLSGPGASVDINHDTLRVVVEPLNLRWVDTRDLVTRLWTLEVELPRGEWNVEVRQRDMRRHFSVRVGSKD
jgi:hypothetical protein